MLKRSCLQKMRAKVHAELQSCVDARVVEEGCAVEAAMALARKCIDNQTPIEHEWILQVTSVPDATIAPCLLKRKQPKTVT